ncbi:exodeoxyribonuclease V subunit alpha [Leptospira mayottensis]|uniref:RecBCD enzyme subunit RecD n=2 Tax=Leptospira mayottensis TaxID=1137606 RepID=A0AA87SV05_9LEPT|nr:exodeoxyribonuclease V subunit alpha [Leptospira mayottensis]AXR60631.1 exodeoxyribonuclease V subunit alpha [Leptospira mayottensis]AXR64442.1 exodeoxyribonuclease V subunit alpha [Leptospira mayottensis]AZQ02939.1 exodeoxyribonuclease V subunit alpha [Leptospira mayottensis 200901116]EKR98351.1 exodeoxyribonuclease V, alpha subunit [Leptospira mayottensis 200901122]TGM95648.1 exodeoxyribonuclease V subunit alpha [Leptospira mayottensis]
MEESFSPFIEKLKSDILGLDESGIKKKGLEKFSDSDCLLEILNSIWSSMEEGSLCVPVKKEWKNVLKLKPPGLVVDKFENKEWVYFEKTHQSKTDLENLLKERIQNNVPPKVDQYRAEKILKNLESKSFSLKETQVKAIFSCLNSSFHIVSGGPGTGKTTVVAFLLEILNQLGQLPSPEEIALVAPTGRAAQRLTESIQENLKKISETEESNFLRGQTVHGLLSYKSSLGGFYYNRERYLPHRLIIVDEVSMVDLNLMLSLWNAIPRNTKKNDGKIPFRFILIGDPHQLPSVEKGAVLSDFLSVLESKKANFVSRLKESNRQKSKGNVSKIVILAEEILRYSPENLNLGTKIDDSFPKTTMIGENLRYESEVVWLQNSANKISDHLSRDELVEKLWTGILQPRISKIGTWKIKNSFDLNEPNFVLKFQEELKKFRCLTVFRNGYWGVEAIQTKIMNLATQDLFHRKGQNPDFFTKRLSKRLYFIGLPILITQNDKNRKLFNGDIGIVLRIESTGELRAVFPIEGKLLPFALDTLPKHEPAFVMSIHKSQGSEYDTILIYIPDHPESQEKERSHRLLNRQILYTGITRAKNQVILAGNPKTWEIGIANSQKRNTGFKI